MKRTFGFDQTHSGMESNQDGFDIAEFSFIYPKEWLAVAVLEESHGRPVRGYLLAHDPDAARVKKMVKSLDHQRVLFFFNGAQERDWQNLV